MPESGAQGISGAITGHRAESGPEGPAMQVSSSVGVKQSAKLEAEPALPCVATVAPAGWLFTSSTLQETARASYECMVSALVGEAEKHMQSYQDRTNYKSYFPRTILNEYDSRHFSSYLLVYSKRQKQKRVEQTESNVVWSVEMRRVKFPSNGRV
ncbi:hypothetical protein MIR68_012177 [Amoeboaphelidium protococcarum]|nr:hypothetical protein MIR68_012177 [Amoeboaphelidium protococcarum]